MSINFNITGAERKQLVNKIEELTGVKAVYDGAPSMAYTIGFYKVSKTGELSWEVSTSETELLVESLLEAGFEAEIPEEVTTLGVSMPRKLFTESQLENLIKLTEAKKSLIKKAMGADDLPINVTDDEVSFPWWGNGVGPDEAHAFTTFIVKLKETAGSLKRVTAKETEVENEKYAFRCFLLKLGFIGDEFKADRKILLKNFTGSAAFKSGHKREIVPPTGETTIEAVKGL